MYTFTMNTLPNNGKNFWQIVIFPNICLYRGKDSTAINFEWLFWSFTTVWKH
jgi:hypothetical protein